MKTSPSTPPKSNAQGWENRRLQDPTNPVQPSRMSGPLANMKAWLSGHGTTRPQAPNPIEHAKQKVKQATTVHDTPSPTLHTHGTVSTQSLSPAFRTLATGADPEDVEWFYTRVDEWARTVVRIRNEVWRRGLAIQPRHDKYCLECGHGCDDPEQGCPHCGCSPDRLADPNPQGRAVLKQFAENANTLRGETLEELGNRRTEENLKHGRGYIVYHHRYTFNDEGRIHESSLENVHVADPARMARLETEEGDPAVAYICLECRGQGNVTPHDTLPKDQACPDCGGAVYPAWYVEKRTLHGTEGLHWYTEWEVHESKWPHTDGSTPASRLMPKLAALLVGSWYNYWALDPARDKRPDKYLVAWGGDGNALADAIQADAEKRKENPMRTPYLWLPSSPDADPSNLGSQSTPGIGMKVLDLGEQEFKSTMPERRQRMADAVRKYYFVSDVQAGDSDAATGGLNNESQKLRSTAQVAEDLQSLEKKWLDVIPEKLGVTQWEYAFPPAIEEDESRETEVERAELEKAKLALEAGLEVRWEDGEAVIMNGEMEPPHPTDPVGGPGSGRPAGSTGGMFSQTRQAHTPKESPVDRAHLFRKAWNQVKQADDPSVPFDTDDELPDDVRAVFGGPSGAVAASDEIHDAYQGLDPVTVEQVNEEIVDSLTQPQGWSSQSIRERLTPILVNAGLDRAEAKHRANTIARMEPRAMASEWKLRLWQDEEQDRQQTFHYTLRGADDFRATKMSRWQREQVPDEGLPLEDLLALLDKSIEKAKRGDFTENGKHSDVPGDPIQLPDGFERRGTITHFGDRDRVVRAT